MQIARRKLLSLMATLPFASSLGKWASAMQNKKPLGPGKKLLGPGKFYLWIHGVFGITFEEKQIRLVCPDLTYHGENHHIYRAGRATYPTNSNFDGTVEVPCPGSYVIEGLYSTKNSSTITGDLDFRERLQVYGTLRDDYSKFLSYIVPYYPDFIYPIRFTHTAFHDCCAETPLVEGASPLGHVFEYCQVDPVNVKITYADSCGNHVLRPADPYCNHLHLFTEPDPQCFLDPKKPCSDGKHHNPDEVLGRLLDCYFTIAPQFRFGDTDNDGCVQLSNVLSFAELTEQFSLFELLAKCQVQIMPTVPTGTTEHPTITAHECPNVIVFSTASSRKNFQQLQRQERERQMKLLER